MLNMATIYKIVTPFFIIGVFIMLYGIVLGDFNISTTGVIIMVVIYFILKKYSPLRVD